MSYIGRLNDDEVLQLIQENATEKAGGNMARLMLTDSYTPREIRGVYAWMNWVMTSWTALKGDPWPTMVQRFIELVPSRGEADLVQLVRAAGQDMPGVLFVESVPPG